MALLTLLPDGSYLVETRLDYFLEKWKFATRAERLVMDDKRPAVRTSSENGITLTTLHPLVWDVVRSKIKPLLQNPQLDHPTRERLCELCSTPLKVKREMEQFWVFHCPTCETNEIHSKTLVGGTVGAGEKEKT